MWKLFQYKKEELEKECERIYEENIEVVYWFLMMKCNLSNAEAYDVMFEAVRELRKHMKKLYGMDKKEQSDWFLKKSYQIARHTFNSIPEVEFEYEQKKI